MTLLYKAKELPMHMKGLDVSEFQGIVDWNEVKASGYQFAMIRAGYGSGTLDKQFKRNAEECNRIGLPFGVYWFCYALSAETARQEAEACLNAIAPYRLDFPICYDIEQPTINYARENGVTVTRELATQFVKSFCDRIEEAGYFAMFYSNRNFLDNYFYPDLSKRYALWYAYYSSCFDGTDCGMWQFSDHGRIPGIRGNVDLNISFVDYPSVICKAGLNHLDGCSPVPPKYQFYTIRSGDTLSEIAERFGTTVSVLQRLNGITNPDVIYAGDTLRIPL